MRSFKDPWKLQQRSPELLENSQFMRVMTLDLRMQILGYNEAACLQWSFFLTDVVGSFLQLELWLQWELRCTVGKCI